MTSTRDRLTAALSGRYRLDRELGAGGMATVYLAHDLKHDRDVALKVLHPELGAVIGAERFLAEIKVTARLQHPHILGLIDSGEADRLLFYVMPYVSGESLRARLQREKQLSIPDAVRVASEVAGALHYAHRQGIVHRDIKPENILLHDGQVLVADFGIALALTSATGGRMTQTGMSLGTPTYMSPEQALGEREITARSDVYSLGAMTYELLTGEPPFTGASSQAITAKVLTEKPLAPSVTRDTVPPHVEAAVLTALAKLPADRWSTAKEFADALGNPALTVTQVTGMRAAVQAPPGRRARTAALIGGVALALGAAAGWLLHRSPAVSAYPVEFYVEADSSHNMELGTLLPLALSPDGRRLAYLGRDDQGTIQLFERDLGERDAHALEGTQSADHPFYSADGQWIAYDDGGQLKKVRVTGGAPITIARIDGNTSGGTWAPDGTIVFSSSIPRVLYRVPADGGTPEAITRSDSSGENHVRPSFLPDGKTVLFASSSGPGRTNGRVGVVSLDSRKVTFLPVASVVAKYASAGELLYVQEDGAVISRHFDPKTLELSGPSRRIAEGVAMYARVAPTFDAAFNGTIVYRPTGGETRLVAVDRDGDEDVVTSAPDIWSPRYSPTGDRIAFARAGVGAGSFRDLWVFNVNQNTSTRLTTDPLNAVDPAWSPDGTLLAFSAGTADRPAAPGGAGVDLFLMRADGVEAPRRVMSRPGEQYQATFTRDGRSLIFSDGPAGRVSNLFQAPVDSAPATPVVETAFDKAAPALSPDGRWIAFMSNESGHYEVYVRAFPGPGPRIAISTGGGREPAWAPNGRELFYVANGKLNAAAVELGTTTVTVKGRRALFDANFVTGRFNRNYDVHPDGNHFLFIKAPAQQRLVVRLEALDRGAH